MSHSRADISEHFQVNIETIRRWSKDFASFLSPGANDSNRSSYTDDDMPILTYIYEAYKRNETTENIIASIAAGARGEWDGSLKHHTVAITEADAVAINQLRVERDDLRHKLSEAEKTIAVLQAQLSNEGSKQEKIDALNREIGRLEARIEIMKEDKRDKPD